MSTNKQLPEHDLTILRKLAERKLEIAASPENRERRESWYKLDGEGGGRPMVLTECISIDNDQLWTTLECEDPDLRGIEQGLRTEISIFEDHGDDHVVEPYMNVNWNAGASNYGVEQVSHRGDNYGKPGSSRWDPPIEDLDRDFHKLRPRTFTADEETTAANMERMETIFDGVIPVRRRSWLWWSFGLTGAAIGLVGLDKLMLYMYDNPEGLHRLMDFLCEDHIAFAEWAEAQGGLTLNNENDYTGSGTLGYTRALPQPDWKEGSPARLKDMWVLLESQETVGCSPEQFEEFVFPYQLKIAEKFGRCYYGCCEPVHSRMHILKRLPNLARVSISPWCDEEIAARELGPDIVYSRKPSPTLISTEKFNEDLIRADLRKTLDITAAAGCRVEIIMKDVHTMNGDQSRAKRWIDIAYEEITAVGVTPRL